MEQTLMLLRNRATQRSGFLWSTRRRREPGWATRSVSHFPFLRPWYASKRHSYQPDKVLFCQAGIQW